MREIKFDAIYKPTGEHFEPYKIDFRDNTTYGNFDGEQNDWCHFSLDGSRGDAILRQYTGLKDKNGVEIYEGDLVRGFLRQEDCTFLSTVVFEYGMFKLRFNEAYGDIIYEDMTYYNAIEFDIIGNIHENPELIGEKV